MIQLEQASIFNELSSTTRYTLSSKKLFSGSAWSTAYMWKNLITGKKTSNNWLYKMFKATALYDFWLVLVGPVD